MATVVVVTDTSLTFDSETNMVSVRLSQKEDNILEFNDKNELSVKELSRFANVYYPMNGIAGEADVSLDTIMCDSSCTRIVAFDEKDHTNDDYYSGDIWERGMKGDEEREGVNMLKLCNAILQADQNNPSPLKISLWPHSYYVTHDVYHVEFSASDWSGDTGTAVEDLGTTEGTSSSSSSSSETPKKTNEELAAEVWRGLWGTGAERKRLLTEAGYDYDAVQEIVNRTHG